MDYRIELTGSRQQWVVPRGETRVGRDAECAIQLLDYEGVSREHLLLEVTADAVWIEDLQTPNGTYVNGERVQRTQLAVGDEITLGNNGPQLRLLSSAHTGTASPAPTVVESKVGQARPAPSAMAVTRRASTPSLTISEPLENTMMNRELTIVRNLLVLTIACCVALGVMLFLQSKEIQENRRALGQMQEQGQNAIGTFMPQLNQRLNQFDGKLDNFNHRMDGMDQAMQQSEDRFVKRLDTEMPIIMDRYLASKAKNNGVQVQMGNR